MKTGIIVYVIGDDSAMDVGRQAALIKDKTRASRVELISAHHGHQDISDAWWSLTAAGMHRIVCMMAEYAGAGNLRLTGKQLQLCG